MTDFSDYKGVWVFCEQRYGQLMPTDLELVSEARRLADEMGCEVTGVLLGHGIENVAKIKNRETAKILLFCIVERFFAAKRCFGASLGSLPHFGNRCAFAIRSGPFSVHHGGFDSYRFVKFLVE